MHDVGGMHEVLAGETSYVRTGAAEPAALDDGASFVEFGGERPGYVFSGFATAEHEDVVVS